MKRQIPVIFSTRHKSRRIEISWLGNNAKLCHDSRGVHLSLIRDDAEALCDILMVTLKRPFPKKRK